jgi:N-acetylglucosaminyl-diphospho-decaprenol L-rhamnosyltransferase
MPRVTLSVISHEQHSLVDALLADLAGIAAPELARIVVTQNLSEPAPATQGLRLPPLQVVRNPRPRGFGANHNSVFAHCETEYFAIVNPDISLTTNPFPALIAALGDGVGVSAPVVLEPDGRVSDTARRMITPWELLSRRGPTYHAPRSPDWFAGMFLLFRSDAFAAVGGFDEGYFMYCEDFDICARLRLGGWRIALADGAHVVHSAQQLSHRSWRYFRWHVSSLVRMWTSAAFWRYRRLLARESGQAAASASIS